MGGQNNNETKKRNLAARGNFCAWMEKVAPLYFAQKHSFVQRRKQSTAVLKKYGDRVPIVIQPQPGCLNAPWLDGSKFLVPKTQTIASLLCHIREKMALKSEIGLFFLVGTSANSATKEQYALIGGCDMVGLLYTQYAKDDGFCYVYYSEESTFGAS